MIIYIKILILLIILVILVVFINFNTILDYFSNYKYTAVIVEPREHKALELVLTNFLTNLNDDWSIIIYHGIDNIDYINDIINKNLTNYKNRITTKNLNVNNLTITDYNNLMTNRDFVAGIPTEIFLIFQTDTIICEQTKNLLYDFIEYDYVGAPWLDSDIGGNGGLSLRRKSKMLEILDKCKYNGMNEDQYFSWGCKDVIINMPSKNKAKEFLRSKNIKLIIHDIDSVN
jgi:hypothetical protein